MVEAVLIFAALSALFEAVVLLKLPLRTRLKLLGSTGWVGFIHLFVILSNLSIHFGTVTGTMTAVTSGLVSFFCIPAIRWYGGCIRRGRYIPGVHVYAITDVQGRAVH